MALTQATWKDLSQKFKDYHSNPDLCHYYCNFIVEPTLRFKGQPGEQYTMFLKDPSGNNLEFKSMTHPENLFAKYKVEDADSMLQSATEA